MPNTDWNGLSDERFQENSKILELVESLCDEALSPPEKKKLRKDFCQENDVTDRTIRNYLARYRDRGAEAFLSVKAREPSPRVHDEGLAAEILALIKERPTRTVPQIRRFLDQDERFAEAIAAVSDRSIYRFLLEHGLSMKTRHSILCADGRRAYHRFQASKPLELVQGDARDGIWIDTPKGKRKTYLFVWIDDYSRKILCGRYYFDEKLPRMEDSFKRMVLRWGIPEKIYVDNGSVYIAKQFAWILSQLKVKKIHHKPYQAYCKGKVEVVNKTIKYGIQAEAQLAGFKTLEELNSVFAAWVDLVYNARIHSSTGEAPDKRFADALPEDHRRVTDIAWFEALFLMRTGRTVNKYGKVKHNSNEYPVTCAPHGSVVEVRFDPFDLRTVFIFKGAVCVETSSVSKLVNITSEVPEEAKTAGNVVSAQSVRYFEKLREEHARLLKNNIASISYSKLTEEKK